MLTTMLFVRNLGVMANFYGQGFDLVEEADSSQEGYVVLTGESTRLALHALPDHVASRLAADDPPEPRSNTAIKLLWTVTDVARTRARLEDLGAQLFDTTSDDAYDGMDLEGNMFRISAS